MYTRDCQFNDDCDPPDDGEPWPPLEPVPPERRDKYHPDRLIETKGDRLHRVRVTHRGRRYRGDYKPTLHEARRDRDAFERDPDAWVGAFLARRKKYVYPVRTPAGLRYEARIPVDFGGRVGRGTWSSDRFPTPEEAFAAACAMAERTDGRLLVDLRMEPGRETGPKASRGRGRDWMKGQTATKRGVAPGPPGTGR